MKKHEPNLTPYSFDAMLGVGGIGSGMFFMLNGDHTLGREESRSGRILDKNDYCKLHIISHYVKVLLGPRFQVLPIGKVGNDDVGRKLLKEMEEVGLCLDYVAVDKTRHTLFSFCFLYPDRSGGNMTTDDSACSTIDEGYVKRAEKEFERFAGRGVALAAPEVPLTARTALLALATRYRFYRVASFTSQEMSDVLQSRVLENVDLLCINLDEAGSALNKTIDALDPRTLVEEAVRAFTRVNPGIVISITHGKNGSYLWDGSEITHLTAPKVDVVSTAGAGDAFTSGIIGGVVAGLPLKEAQQLATLAGSYSVTSPDTIHKGLNRQELLDLAKRSHATLSPNVLRLLEVQQ
jgi:ribokinase